MLKEGVRLDRVRGGRQKYRRNTTSNPYQMQIFPSSNSMPPTSLDDIKILEILTLCEPEVLAVGSMSIELMYNKTSTRENLTPGSASGSDCGSSNDKDSDDKSDIFMENRCDTEPQEMLSVLSDIYDRELVSVIGWAKQIPGSFISEQNKKLNIDSNFAFTIFRIP